MARAKSKFCVLNFLFFLKGFLYSTSKVGIKNKKKKKEKKKKEKIENLRGGEKEVEIEEADEVRKQRSNKG
jgi:hypothetical protein